MHFDYDCTCKTYFLYPTCGFISFVLLVSMSVFFFFFLSLCRHISIFSHGKNIPFTVFFILNILFVFVRLKIDAIEVRHFPKNKFKHSKITATKKHQRFSLWAFGGNIFNTIYTPFVPFVLNFSVRVFFLSKRIHYLVVFLHIFYFAYFLHYFSYSTCHYNVNTWRTSQ